MRCFVVLIAVALMPLAGARGQPEGAVVFSAPAWRHGTNIANAAMSPDGKRLATAAEKSVIVWDLDNGNIVRRFPCPPSETYCCPGLRFSPDGTRLAYVRGPSFARVWDLTDGRELLTLQRNNVQPLCAFTADGKQFLIGDHQSLHTFDLKTGDRLRSRPASAIHLMSPDHRLGISVDEKRYLTVRDLETGGDVAKWEVVAFHEGVHNGVDLSPDGKLLAVVHNHQEIQLRDFPGGKVRHRIEVPRMARTNAAFSNMSFEYRLSFSGDGRELLLASTSGHAFRWDVATGKELKWFGRHPANVTAAFKRPGGQIYVTTAADGAIRRWDAEGRGLSDAKQYSGRVIAALSRDGRHVAVGDSNGRLDIWDSAGKRIVTLQQQGAQVARLEFSHDGRKVATCGGEKLKSWDLPSGKLREALDIMPGGDLLVLRDGNYIAGAPPTFVEAGTGRERWASPAPTTVMALSPDGRTLATAPPVPRLHFVDVESGKVLARAPLKQLGRDASLGAGSLAYSPDGRLAVGLADHVLLCDGRTGEERTRFLAAPAPPTPPHFAIRLGGHEARDAVNALSFGASGQWLATGAGSGSVRVWESATGIELWRRDAHDGAVDRVAYGPAGRMLLSNGTDSQVLLWHLAPKTSDSRDAAALWGDLASGDGPTAFRAIWALSAHPDVVRFLRTKLAPAAPLDAALVARLIAELSDAKFAMRDAAQKRLTEMGERAWPALEEALTKTTAAEPQRRIQRLLESRDGFLASLQAQPLRAVQALALADTPEAKVLLRELSAGSAGASLTRAARMALTRE